MSVSERASDRRSDGDDSFPEAEDYGSEARVLADEPAVVGKRHLRLAFAADPRPVRGIAFNLGDRARELTRGQRVDAVFHASFDTWRGGRQVQLVVRDLRTR